MRALRCARGAQVQLSRGQPGVRVGAQRQLAFGVEQRLVRAAQRQVGEPQAIVRPGAVERRVQLRCVRAETPGASRELGIDLGGVAEPNVQLAVDAAGLPILGQPGAKKRRGLERVDRRAQRRLTSFERGGEPHAPEVAHQLDVLGRDEAAGDASPCRTRQAQLVLVARQLERRDVQRCAVQLGLDRDSAEVDARDRDVAARHRDAAHQRVPWPVESCSAAQRTSPVRLAEQGAQGREILERDVEAGFDAGLEQPVRTGRSEHDAPLLHGRCAAGGLDAALFERPGARVQPTREADRMGRELFGRRLEEAPDVPERNAARALQAAHERSRFACSQVEAEVRRVEAVVADDDLQSLRPADPGRQLQLAFDQVDRATLERQLASRDGDLGGAAVECGPRDARPASDVGPRARFGDLELVDRQLGRRGAARESEVEGELLGLRGQLRARQREHELGRGTSRRVERAALDHE